ncbi:MAG: biotin/lipoate--protein ligase family protein [Wenzhouxiangella sp.]|jgi:BirA family biotin operon repressor/biotin-[acetyl-CoA-carboxylase] ligase|nr:biotin/lipoate--protein ligase family protein [Wenzhouxiangella sp.]
MATDKKHQPELPAAYEPVELDGAANVMEAARRMAAEGSSEGTLVWACRQAAGEFRPGKNWFSPDDGLYVGLVLEPEFAPQAGGEMALIGLLSLGMALAESVAPLTDLRYRWPNDVLLSGSKVGGVALRRDLEAGWMILAVSVNVGQEPAEVIGAGCAQIEGGNPDLEPIDLLQSFAREFLHWINRWDEEGLKAILTALRGRWGQPGESVLIELDDGTTLAGAFKEVGEHGQLVLDTADGEKSVTLHQFFGLE